MTKIKKVAGKVLIALGVIYFVCMLLDMNLGTAIFHNYYFKLVFAILLITGILIVTFITDEE